jgi:hypothetical protein
VEESGLWRLLARVANIREAGTKTFSRRNCPKLEEIPWSYISQVLVLMRLCEPSSELAIVEDLYERALFQIC